MPTSRFLYFYRIPGQSPPPRRTISRTRRTTSEHDLAVWIEQNEQDYINGTGLVTTNPAIRAKWIEFISDPKYSKYLRVKVPQ